MKTREEYVKEANELLARARFEIQNGNFNEALEHELQVLGFNDKLIELGFESERKDNISEGRRCFFNIVKIREEVKRDIKDINLRLSTREVSVETMSKIRTCLQEATNGLANGAHGYCMIAFSNTLSSKSSEFSLEDITNAKIYAKKSLNERIELYGPKHAEIADGIELLGSIYHLSGKTIKGLACVNMAVKVNAELKKQSVEETMYGMCERFGGIGGPVTKFHGFSIQQARDVIQTIATAQRESQFARSLDISFDGQEENIHAFKVLKFLEKHELNLPDINMVDKRVAGLEAVRAVKAAGGLRNVQRLLGQQQVDETAALLKL